MKGMAGKTGEMVTPKRNPKNAYDSLRSYAWSAVHETILQMTYTKCELKEIAKTTKMNSAIVSKIRSSKPFRDRLYKLQQDVNERAVTKISKEILGGNAREFLNGKQYEAAKKLYELMSSENEMIAMKAAQDILDRTGMKAIEVIQNLTRNYTPEEVAKAQQTISEIETTIARLDNKDSNFLLVRQNKNIVEDAAVSSVTDKGSDAPTQQESSTTVS